MQLQQLGGKILVGSHDIFAPCNSLLLTLQPLTTPCFKGRNVQEMPWRLVPQSTVRVREWLHG